MSAPTDRKFSHTTAARARVPLLVGLTAPSSGGKTKSALRLADGMRSVDGGRVFLVDTEANRSLHYADEHTFEHVPFSAPFGPRDYVAAIDYCVAAGATVVIVDSVSHEWEGAGGVLDIHDRELDRIAGPDERARLKNTMRAWGPAKRDHGLFVRTLLQTPCHFILCFRAKSKLKIRPGKPPEERGFMAIGGEDLTFEMTINALLLPGAKGCPTWRSDEEGERLTIKRPGWAESMLVDGETLDEKTGAALATWAAGTKKRSILEILEELERCNDPATLGALKTETRIAWKSANPDQRRLLRESAEAAAERIAAAAEPPPEASPMGRAPGEEGDRDHA